MKTFVSMLSAGLFAFSCFALPPDSGTRVETVRPQPITRNPSTGILEQARDQIWVYFSGEPLDVVSAETTAYYQLYTTEQTLNNQDDTCFYPVTADYDLAANLVRLTFDSDLESLTLDPSVFRLEVGCGLGIPNPPTQLSLYPGDSFSLAHDLGILDYQGYVITGLLEPAHVLALPGSDDDPGHDNVQHVLSADSWLGIDTLSYSFPEYYGEYPPGNNLANQFTEDQKERVRDMFELFTWYFGIQFVEVDDGSFKFATGDMRVIDPNIDTGPGGTTGLSGGGLIILDHAETWDDGFLGNWYLKCLELTGIEMHLFNTPGLPPPTMMGSDPGLMYGQTPEAIFPGCHDVVHGQHIQKPEMGDVEVYKFAVTEPGIFSAEIIEERAENNAYPADFLLQLYQDSGDSIFPLARNDDYFSNDPAIKITIDEPGYYYLTVAVSGNDAFDPNIEDSGFGGRSENSYTLCMGHQPLCFGIQTQSLEFLDGDADGTPGGSFLFWFRVQYPANTFFVDKDHDPIGGQPVGTLTNPYNAIQDAITDAVPGTVIHVVANGGSDDDVSTLGDNAAYEFGYDPWGSALSDGTGLHVPRDVFVTIESGVIFKLRQAVITAGSYALPLDSSGGAIQFRGMPEEPIYMTSYNDEAIGLDTFPPTTTPTQGDWGGVFINLDIDRAQDQYDPEIDGLFLNFASNVDIRYGGGNVTLNSVAGVYCPFHLKGARATLINNSITFSADAAIAASPDTFLESRFRDIPPHTFSFEPHYDRKGPMIYGNDTIDNSTNGLFIAVIKETGSEIVPLTVSAIWDDTDIVHVLPENLHIKGNPGGSYQETSICFANRMHGSLVGAPGLVIKCFFSSIIARFGAHVFLEGHPDNPIVVTSYLDDDVGGCSTYDTNNNGSALTPAPGDWGGIYVGQSSQASIAHSWLGYGGGQVSVEGSFAGMNMLEVHQADLRVHNTNLSFAQSGVGGSPPVRRGGLGDNSEGVIFVKGAQPTIIGNLFRTNFAPVVSIDVNSLNHTPRYDTGGQTEYVDPQYRYRDNCGPLIRENILWTNQLNGMLVRGGTLNTQSVWDDTDIVHVLKDHVYSHNMHSYGGIRLESAHDASLVVKLEGYDAGFTATGAAMSIPDRIGGMFHVVDQPGFPVVLTSLYDDSVGAGRDPYGAVVTDTNNDGAATSPAVGDWLGVTADGYAHWHDFLVFTEQEGTDPSDPDVNDDIGAAQWLGALAPGGPNDAVLGFNLHGFLHRADDVDVYAFSAQPGTEIWIDLDRTTYALDAVVEVLDFTGSLIARSVNSTDETAGISTPVGIAQPFTNTDHYTWNPKDPGMLIVVPGISGQMEHMYIRIRSNGPNLDTQLHDGRSKGVYLLQVRQDYLDEFPGTSCPKPQVTADPQGGHICQGGDFMMSAEAQSVFQYSELSANMTYTWYKDGILVPGTDGNVLAISDATIDDAGVYYAEIFDGCATATTQNAILTWGSGIEALPSVQAQGLVPATVSVAFQCEPTGMTWDWWNLNTMEFLGADIPTLVLDTLLPETTTVQAVITSGAYSGDAAQAVILVGQNPDPNGDGCHDLLDWWFLAERWHTSMLNDPTGDGWIDVRDFLFVSTELGCP